MRRFGCESPAPSSGLLVADDPEPFIVHNEAGSSALVIVCDHAGRAVPGTMDLGISGAEMERHIAWDIGAGPLAMALGEALDACVVRQPYCRLVVDCNRSPARPDAMPEISDGVTVPANQSLTAEQRQARIVAIHAPYHAQIAQLLDARAAAGRATALVLLHSFTPVMNGLARPWLFGILHTGQPLAGALLEGLRASGVGEVGDNQPYAMDETDYTAGRHGSTRGLDFVEIEVRQDLIADVQGQAEVSRLLARLLTEADAAVGQT